MLHMNKGTVAIIAIVVMLFCAGTLYLFKPTQVNSAQWQKSYSLYSNQPYGLSIFKDLLEHQYSTEAINICDGLCPLPQGDATGYSYIYVGSFFYRAQAFIDELIDFNRRGGQVVFISEDYHLEIDSVTMYAELKSHEADEATLSSQDQGEFTFRHVMYDLDSTIEKNYFAPNELDTIDAVTIDTLLTIQDTIAVFSSIQTAQVQFSFHTLPAMFANVTMKYGDGLRHFNYFVDRIAAQQIIEYSSDTLLLGGHNNERDRSPKLKKRASSDGGFILLDSPENNVPDEYSAAFNPIQFIFANPSLKWSYLIILIGAVSYIYFKGKRRQQAIPTLAANENTSLEFVDTISDLFRSQNNPSQLVNHMEENLKQFIKRKYFINSNENNYAKRITQKTKIDEEEIKTLFKRLEAAKNNVRFREEQLINLNQTIEEFYKKCQ